MISAEEALQRLVSGNQRFVSNTRAVDPASSQTRRNELVSGQHPFAVILGCADSRVPAEMVFDQDFGDLFVVRVAGNIVQPALLGSIEFAVQSFGTPLIVVLGHTQCGAVKATLDVIETSSKPDSPNLEAIVESIKPAVMPLTKTLKDDKEALLAQAIRANIFSSADHLQRNSKVLEQLVQSNMIKIVCAEYSLDTGRVDFIDSDT